MPRSASTSTKSESFCGRSSWASTNSVRALSHFEKWWRSAWKARLSPGTTRTASSRPRRSEARATSSPPGRRKTKSPKPKYWVMNRRSSCSSSGEPFSRKSAPSARAEASCSGREECRSTGKSGKDSRTPRARSSPAVRERAPSRGNSTSEIKPSRSSG